MYFSLPVSPFPICLQPAFPVSSPNRLRPTSLQQQQVLTHPHSNDTSSLLAMSSTFPIPPSQIGQKLCPPKSFPRRVPPSPCAVDWDDL